eukprot:tig00021623_g23016.t1
MKLALLAGEPSGDAIGARLMASLRRLAAGPARGGAGARVEFVGVGGDLMVAEGLRPVFPMSDICVMGLAELVPHLPRLWLRIRQAAAAIRSERPDAVVTIDSKGFNFRVLKALRADGAPCPPLVHYVAPSVWAYRNGEGRAQGLKSLVDHLLCILPNEPAIFERTGVPATFVGHPALDEAAGAVFEGATQRAGFRAEVLGLPDKATALCVLPGSRPGEVDRLLPVFAEAARLLAADFPDLHAVIPTVPLVHERVQALAGRLLADRLPLRVLPSSPDRRRLFAACDAAVAASGTVSVELAAAGAPQVVAYDAHPLTALAARRLAAVRHVSLLNIFAQGEPPVPEFVFEACRPGPIAGAAGALLADPAARAAQAAGVAGTLARMRRPPSLPHPALAGRPPAEAGAGDAQVVLEAVHTRARR